MLYLCIKLQSDKNAWKIEFIAMMKLKKKKKKEEEKNQNSDLNWENIMPEDLWILVL